MGTKWFRRSWQIFLKYAPGLLLAGFIFWGFVILLKQDNWVAISALATLVLAIAAFWAIWQNYRFRKEDRKRERRARSASELYRWAEEARRLYYLPYNQHKDEIYNGLIKLVTTNVAATTAAIIVGDEFVELTKRAAYALASYYVGIEAKRTKGKQVDEPIMKEFEACFYGLEFYLDVLRIWDHDYAAFIKEARAKGALPLAEHVPPDETLAK